MVGENGTGKSPLLEGIAALAGYDDAGGGKGYRAIDHAGAVDANGGLLAKALRAACRPKPSSGWFFKAKASFPLPDISTGLPSTLVRRRRASCPIPTARDSCAFFQERCSRQGVYLFDEPESALPARSNS